MNIKIELPESFYQGEERCGYYVTPEMKKIWAVELDLISELSRVCNKYNLQYYADGGTLLGAARHNGFIPWDDDIDILMMRKDYDRLCEVADKEFRHPYFLDEIYKTSKRPSSFSKLVNEDTALIEDFTSDLIKGRRKVGIHSGIFIDIFVADNMPDDEKEFWNLYKRAKFFGKIARYLYVLNDDNYYPAPKKWKRPFKFTAFMLVQALKACGIKLPDHEKYFQEFLRTIQSCSDTTTKRIGQMAFIPYLDGDRYFNGIYYHSNIWDRADYEKITYFPFEMLTIPAPAGYDNVLSKLYGNWHELRIKELHGVFYDTDKTYKYYIEHGVKGDN